MNHKKKKPLQHSSPLWNENCSAFPAFVNESNGAVNTEEGVRRVIYSSQAYDANAKGVEGGIKLLDEENSSKFGISGDKGGTHLWWDNADKGNF